MNIGKHLDTRIIRPVAVPEVKEPTPFSVPAEVKEPAHVTELVTA